MSDESPKDALSVRDVKTRTYRVIDAAVSARFGGEFSAWAWGDVFMSVLGHGPVLKRDELDTWVRAGKIKEVAA